MYGFTKNRSALQQPRSANSQDAENGIQLAMLIFLLCRLSQVRTVFLHLHQSSYVLFKCCSFKYDQFYVLNIAMFVIEVVRQNYALVSFKLSNNEYFSSRVATFICMYIHTSILSIIYIIHT